MPAGLILPLISPCSFDRSHQWVITQYALNLVSFVFNFKLSSTVCLLLILYNARALRCSSEQGKLHNPALKELPGLLLSTWPMIVHVSGMTTVHPSTFVSAFSCLSFLQGLVHCPLSSLKLILRASDQKSSLLLLNPPCCAFFFPA